MTDKRIEPVFFDPTLKNVALEDVVSAPNSVMQQSDSVRSAAKIVPASSVKLRAAQAQATAHHVRKTVWGWITRHERSLSAVSMIGGFVFDNFAFRRIDLPNTQLLFLAYLIVSGAAILLLHAFETRARSGRPMPKWHSMLPIATQFTLGGLWSAFLVFYTRGAVFAVSWPFLAVLAAIFIGNEVFKKYHSQLVFTATLYFFALYSYLIVTVPIFTRSIGTLTFVAAGIAALLIFGVYLRLIKAAGRDRWAGARWQIGAGAVAVFAALNVFYFTGGLPPLPLVLASSGIYHSVVKAGDIYQAQREPEPWITRFGATPVMHVAAGQPLSVYSAVFAPIRFHEMIVDHWKHYDPATAKWKTVSRVKFAINGGRDGGYRNYTVQRKVSDGDWRVDVDTLDGRIIGRIPFTVQTVPQPIATTAITLK